MGKNRNIERLGNANGVGELNQNALNQTRHDQRFGDPSGKEENTCVTSIPLARRSGLADTDWYDRGQLDLPGSIGGRAVHFRVVLSGKGTTTVSSPATVCVHDDFLAGETR